MKLEYATFKENLNIVLENLSAEVSIKSFISNMEHLNHKEETFAGWLYTYFLWSEIGSEEDIKNYFWYLEEEK